MKLKRQEKRICLTIIFHNRRRRMLITRSRASQKEKVNIHSIELIERFILNVCVFLKMSWVQVELIVAIEVSVIACKLIYNLKEICLFSEWNKWPTCKFSSRREWWWSFEWFTTTNFSNVEINWRKWSHEKSKQISCINSVRKTHYLCFEQNSSLSKLTGTSALKKKDNPLTLAAMAASSSTSSSTVKPDDKNTQDRFMQYQKQAKLKAEQVC